MRKSEIERTVGELERTVQELKETLETKADKTTVKRKLNQHSPLSGQQALDTIVRELSEQGETMLRDQVAQQAAEILASSGDTLLDGIDAHKLLNDILWERDVEQLETILTRVAKEAVAALLNDSNRRAELLREVAEVVSYEYDISDGLTERLAEKLYDGIAVSIKGQKKPIDASVELVG